MIGRKKEIDELNRLYNSNNAELVVVGHPYNMDGSRGERAQTCEFVAGEIEKLRGIKTVLWDERATSVTAANMLTESGTFGKKRKEVLDAVAATVILESYLAWRKNHKDEI